MVTTQKPDVYQDVTNRIIAALESGTPPWRKGWDPDHPGNMPSVPINATTLKPYKGVNFMLCTLAMPDGDPRFCTFRQAKENGWHVKAGAKGIRLVKWVEPRDKSDEINPADAPDEETPTPQKTAGVKHKVLFPVSFTVFHASQIEGIPPLAPPDRIIVEDPEKVAMLDTLNEKMGVSVVHGSQKASYNWYADRITLPVVDSFASIADYVGTRFHETMHSTGHEARLGRKFPGPFGSPEYAREELRVEIATVMESVKRGMPLSESVFSNHVAYVESWLSTLKKDKREIFRAAADAERMCVYIENVERGIIQGKNPELAKVSGDRDR